MWVHSGRSGAPGSRQHIPRSRRHRGVLPMPTIDDLVAALELERSDLVRKRDGVMEAAKALLEASQRAGRANLAPDEDRELTVLFTQRDSLRGQIERVDARLAHAREAQADEGRVTRAQEQRVPTGRSGGAPVDAQGEAQDGARWVRRNDGRPAAVERGQRFADHAVVADHARLRAASDQHIVGTHGSLGQYVRALSTTSGSALVPTVWAGDIIDRARNAARVLQAGATIVPMDAKTVQIGRLTTDPVAAFRTEGSLITATDPAFDNVTLDAKTMSALVVMNMEFVQDAPNADEVVSNAIARAMATELDKQALFGGVTTGGEVGATGFNTTFPTPPNPRGVLATLLAVASSSVLGSGANGTALTATTPWNEVLDTIFTVRQNNEEPNAILWNAKMAQKLAKTYDTTGQPLTMAPDVAGLERYVTNQIPSFTQGTATGTATDVFVGDWTQLLIGQRLDVTIQVLTERYAEFGQVGIVAHWRGDVALARPRAFAVYRYLIGA
ncbi:phage major capsid protein [Micromonospora terminaliae]|uniref:Phage major capsid protein n=1 Tax=Micromonospora terminaliae TaxID=1914461 RepID=A0AAJ3DKN8_9ACTN|nr:phage major capsid protein [Micromonospora terminaliae]NES30062.1 phage major capsid protein [Micromonospora terminaliae]